MRVPCTVCKKLFDAKRSTAKYCGNTCRQRAFRDPPAPKATPEQGTHPLVTRTVVELEEAGVLDTVMGQTALRLAEKMTGTFDTGSAVASLSREFRAVMAEALAGGTKKADGLDELTARRMQKASGA